MQTYLRAAASVPFVRLSCLAGVASRSQRWSAWTPSPPRSGNKPSWAPKSSPHELGGKSPSDKERRSTPPPRISECRSPLSSWWQSCCFVQNLAFFANVKKLPLKVQYLTALFRLKKINQFKLLGQWKVHRKSAVQHVHIRWLQTCN